MNRPFSPKHRYRNALVRNGNGFAATVITCVVILVGFRFALPRAWDSLTASAWNAGSSVTSRIAGVATLESKVSLRRERDTYASQVVALSSQNAALSAKVADLTKLLGSRTEPSAGIVAAVLARPPVAPYDVLIIDQGSSGGVRLGAEVYGNGGTPLGSIGQVDGRQSRVTLFSMRGATNIGWAGEGRIPVTLTGAGSGAFTATLPKAAGVKIGDGVYLASGGAYPVGTIVSIETDPSSPTITLDIRPYANPFSLVWVTVAK